MFADIFTKIENALTAQAAFDGFNFYRFRSDQNTSLKNKANVPYNALFFSLENANLQNGSRALVLPIVTYELETKWVTTNLDINDIARLQEKQTYANAIKKALLEPTNGYHLDFANIEDIDVIVREMFIGGLETVNQLGLITEIRVEYAQGL